MAGSIENMENIYKKTFKYTPPSPPANLIDCSNLTIDFTARKFLNIGLDPTDEFNTMLHIITSSRYIKITPDFLRRISSLMGDILSFILDSPKYEKRLFLETDQFELTSMVYMGENVLVIECKNQIGCRVLLNRADLIQLQYLEWCIHETVTRKNNIIRPAVLNQFAMIGNYIDRELIKVEKPKTNEEMIIFIKNLRNDLITTNPDFNFVSQLKMLATSQLAEQWKWRAENTEFFTESEMMRLISPLSPSQYSSMTPMYDDNDFSQARAADEENGIDEFLKQINPTQTTWPPTKTLPVPSSLPTSFIDTLPDYDSDNFAQDPYGRIKSYNIEPSPTSPAVDDPSSLNHSPSILDSSLRKKRNAKRKLFLNDIV